MTETSNAIFGGLWLDQMIAVSLEQIVFIDLGGGGQF